MPLTTETLARAVKDMGVHALELVPQADYELIANLGLINAMALVNPFADEGIAPFVRGFNNPKYRERVVEATIEQIDLCAQYGWPHVIAFVGYSIDPVDKENPITLFDGFESCVRGLKKVEKYAAAKNVTICLEHLNTRDASHPMMGHPGYQGDDLDLVLWVVRACSPSVKVLFDVYHVQVMHGDIIRRLRACASNLGHIHTAGNPGRCELGPGQEISYPPIMNALVEIGYKGYVGHEHIPVWPDKIASIRNSVEICDV